MAAKYKDIAKRLLAGVQDARNELFALMLAEKAHRVRGRFTDAYERLDKAMKEAEEGLKGEGE